MCLLVVVCTDVVPNWVPVCTALVPVCAVRLSVRLVVRCPDLTVVLGAVAELL